MTADPVVGKQSALSPKGPRLQRTVRLPLFVSSIVLLVLLAFAGRWLHGVQVQRMSRTFVVRAAELEKEQRWSEAVQYLERYLRLHPNDASVKIQAAWMFDRVSASPESKRRAVALFYRAANAAAPAQPGNDATKSTEVSELRTRLAELLLEVERPKSAEELAVELTQGDATNGRALRVLALAQFAQLGTSKSNPGIAVANLEKAMAARPQDVELATRLAQIYRDYLRAGSDQDRIDRADRVMDELVRKNPTLAEAYLARYSYRQRYGGPLPQAENPQMDADLARARALAPKDSMVLTAVARDALRRNALDEAEQHLRELIAAAPDTADGYDLLSRVEQVRGQTAAAVAVLREGVKRLGAGNLQLNVRLAEVLASAGELSEARTLITDLRRTYEGQRFYLAAPVRTFWQHSIDLVEAHWCIRSELPEQACNLLTPVTASGTAEHRLQALNLLGASRAMLNQPTEAAAAFERATAGATNVGETTLLAADSLLALGQIDQAIQLYRQQLARANDAEVWYRLARAALFREARRTPAARDWTLFRDALKKAGTAAPSGLSDAWRLVVLEANQVLLEATNAEDRNQRREVVFQMMRQAEERYSAAADFERELIGIYARLGRMEDADRLLAAWSQKTDDAVQVARTRAGLAEMRGQADLARQLLTAALDSQSDEKSAAVVELRRALAELALRRRQLNEARSQWQAILQVAPRDVRALRSLLESMLATTDPGPEWEAQCREWERQLEEIEGKDSSNVRFFRACRAVRLAKGTADPRLQTAEELLKQIESERRGWAAVATLKGLLREQQGRIEEAIAAYDEAIRLGERRVVVFERQVVLLFRLGRTDEAARVVQQLGSAVDSSSQLTSLAIMQSLQNQEFDVALAASRRGVAARPADPVAWLWLGSLLEKAAGSDASAQNEAEQAFWKSAELAPRDLRVWQMLFAYCERRGDKQGIRKALEYLDMVARREKLPDSEYQLLALAACQSLDDAEQMEMRLQKALTTAPTDARIYMVAASYCVQRNDPRAESFLRKVVELSPTWGEARRDLANFLAAQGADQWKEAQDLLSRPEPDPKQAMFNQRLLAALCVQRGDYERAERILTLLVDDEQKPDDPQEVGLLALVLEALGKIDAAEQQLTKLADCLPKRAEHLIALTEFLLRHDRLSTVDRWLSELDVLQPNQWRGVLLRARWLKAKGNDPEVASVVDGHVESRLGQEIPAPEKVQALRRAGDLYAALHMDAAAERWYRELATLEPESDALLARCLARQGRVDEALDIGLKKATQSTSLHAAITLAQIVTEVALSEEQFARTAALLRAAENAHGSDENLKLALANVAMVRGQRKEAIDRYQQLLDSNPTHVIALNNLAVILGEQAETRQRALDYIDKAIAANKTPSWALLDSKGTILLNDGKVAEALPLLETAVVPKSADPRNRLHLAVAYLRSGNKEKAKQAYRVFRTAVTDERMFTPGERQMVMELDQAFPDLAAAK